MSFDPRYEDYVRLSLRFARTLDELPPDEATRAFASFGRRFVRDRDSLPQTDADRAFHLVAEAATLIDYELPFADETQARAIIKRGHDLLNEALALDPFCADASRMLASSEQTSFDGYYAFLETGLPEVEARCQEECAKIPTDEQADRAALARELALRPYVRWLASMASQAVICGRNREALQVCARALKADPADGADIRFTAVLALAKLEDEEGLEKLVSETIGSQRDHGAMNAWVYIARAALAYKRCDMVAAKEQLRTLSMLYPHACATLVRQHELPDGVFSRLAVPPLSEDELIVAVSEATVLLQEGREQEGRGPFGAWVAREAERMAPLNEMSEIAEAKRYVAEQAARRASYDAGDKGERS